jgi:hypothetical protein
MVKKMKKGARGENFNFDFSPTIYFQFACFTLRTSPAAAALAAAG